MDSYHEFWCPPTLREFDPEGCGIGLGIGFFWVPLIVVAVVIACLYCLIKKRNRS